jgi:hypothetical protein
MGRLLVKKDLQILRYDDNSIPSIHLSDPFAFKLE